ncbi:MAG: ABC transporter ATP-binding protein [Caldiserica bacterium]|nr:ABC transporter ATP-binding protein [Caldisericota bacterium]
MKIILKFFKKEFKLYALIISLLLIVDSSQVIIPIFTKRAIDAIANSNKSLILKNGLYIIIISAAIIAIRYFYNYILRYLTLKLDHDIKISLFNKYLNLPKKLIQQLEIGDLMARVTNDTTAVRFFLIMGFIGIIDIFFLGITTFVAMFIMNAKLTLIVILPLLILIPITLNFGKKIHLYFRKVQDLFGEMTVRIREAIGGIRVIKAFVRENFYLSLFMNINEQYLKENLKLVKLDGFLDPTINLLINISMFNLLVFGGLFFIRNKADIGTIVAFFQYIQTLAWPVMAVGFSIALYQRAKASLNRIEEALNIKPEIIDAHPKQIESLKGNITINKLSFKFGEDENFILKDVSVEIDQGTLVGITGPPGSGKTTLLNLIMKIYNTKRNTINIDRVDIFDIPLKLFKEQIASVPQEPFLFSDSILNNIKLAKENATTEEVEQAAKIADIHKDILNFPRSYETIVGEQGVTLSGGERQRVSIARAIITKRPIMIFDDPLSAVDTETERNIIQNLKEFFRDNKITAIIVSQRISALSILDKVIVIANGKVLEQGKPDELLNKNGYYHHLYRKQLLEGIEI